MSSHTPPREPPATALITGASSGIGLSFARVLAAHGHDLVLVARSADRLATLAAELTDTHGITAVPLPADLADPDAPAALFTELAACHITPGILINNAGFGLRGDFRDTPLHTELEMIRVNVAALTALTKLALPHMLARGRGRIMNVASTAAFQPGPLMAVYYATKAYVLHFSEAIAEELRDTNVTVTALCPGPTRTNFAAVAGMRDTRAFSGKIKHAPDDVARFGYDAMMRGTRVAVPGAFNRLVAFAHRIAPRHVVARTSRRAQAMR